MGVSIGREGEGGRGREREGEGGRGREREGEGGRGREREGEGGEGGEGGEEEECVQVTNARQLAQQHTCRFLYTYLDSGVGGICLHVWDTLGPLRGGWGKDEEELVWGKCVGVYRGRGRRVESVCGDEGYRASSTVNMFIPGLWSWWNMFACHCY